MAGGIDWFRWHHGSVTDPKFQLVAKRAGASLPDVLAVWAYLLEGASAATERGHIGGIDCEAVDCLFGFDDGVTALILDRMRARELIGDGVVLSWEKRQPKREREDDNAAERKRRQRETDAAIQNNVTPCHATSHQETPREEKRREEEKKEHTHTALRGDWVLPKAWGQWAIEHSPHWTPDVVRVVADRFAAHAHSKARTSADWLATWQLWCSDPLTQSAHGPPKSPPQSKPAPSITVPSNDDKATQALLAERLRHAAQTESVTPEQREATAQRLRETRQKLRAA